MDRPKETAEVVNPSKFATERPVLSSLLVTLALAVLLISMALILPFRGNADHAVGHLAIAIPLLILGGLVVWRWPALAPGRAALVARWALIAGLFLFGVGWTVEALGALGYEDDGIGRASELVRLHAIGNAMASAAFMPMMAGVILTVGVVIAKKRGWAQSKGLWWFVVAASAAIVAFYVGALVYGY